MISSSDSLSDSELIDSIYQKACDIELEGLVIDDLSPEQRQALRNVFVIIVLESQVNNGGFDQYFFNTKSEYEEDTRRALRIVGAVQHLNLFDQMIKLNRTSGLRLLIARTVLRKWSRWEAEFYDLPSLYSYVAKYIRDNPQFFQ